MKLRATSQEIDKIETDTVVLSFFHDERPLKGAVGLTDWRLGGFLSRLIMSKWIDGKFDDPLLMPANHRMQSNKVFVVGLGPVSAYDLSRYQKVVEHIADALFKINVTRFALPLPGVLLAGLDPGDAAEIFGRAVHTRYGKNPDMMAGLEVVVIAPGPDLKRINPVLARIERGGAA
jgi:hypothetical protein